MNQEETISEKASISELTSDLIKKIESYAKSKRLNKLSIRKEGLSGLELLFGFKEYQFNLIINNKLNPFPHWEIATDIRDEQRTKHQLILLYEYARDYGIRLCCIPIVPKENHVDDKPDSQKITEIYSGQQWMQYPEPVPIEDLDEVVEIIEDFRKMIKGLKNL